MLFLTFASIISCYVMWIPTLVSASSINITIDDQYGDPVTGKQFSYSPSNEWALGSDCSSCTAKPDPSQAWNGTWHDSSFLPASESSPTNATVSFNGTAFYVYCIIYQTSTDSDAQSNMRFILDGEDVGTFVLPESTSSSVNYLYHYLVFSKDQLSPEEHTFTLVNGQQGSNTDAMTLLDYLVYTTDVPGSNTTNSTTSTSSTSSSAILTETSTATATTTLLYTTTGHSSQIPNKMTVEIMSSAVKTGTTQSSVVIHITPMSLWNASVTHPATSTQSAPGGAADDARPSGGMNDHTREIVIIASTVGGSFILVAVALVFCCCRRRMHGDRRRAGEPAFEELESPQTRESFISGAGTHRDNHRPDPAPTDGRPTLISRILSVTEDGASDIYTASPTRSLIAPRHEGQRNEIESVMDISASTNEQFPRPIDPGSVIDLCSSPIGVVPEPFPYNPTGPLSPNRAFFPQVRPREKGRVRSLQNVSSGFRYPDEAIPLPSLNDDIAETSERTVATFGSIGTVATIPGDYIVPESAAANALGDDWRPRKMAITARPVGGEKVDTIAPLRFYRKLKNSSKSGSPVTRVSDDRRRRNIWDDGEVRPPSYYSGHT